MRVKVEDCQPLAITQVRSGRTLHIPCELQKGDLGGVPDVAVARFDGQSGGGAGCRSGWSFRQDLP